jgi:murein DD-endopeptidase MepM/ murein hydrolase activator NlpD
MRATTPCLLAHFAAFAFACGLPNPPAVDTRAQGPTTTGKTETAIVLAPVATPPVTPAPVANLDAVLDPLDDTSVAARSSGRSNEALPPFGDDVRLELSATAGEQAQPGPDDPSRAVEAAKPAIAADPATMDDATLAREDELTRQALVVMLERAGLDTWEHPEFDRVLDNPDGLPLVDLLRRRYEILRAVPQHAPADGWISSTFGKRPVPDRAREQFHKGIDIAATIGTVVYAPGDGVVRFAGRYGSFGKYLSIVHGYGIVTKFAHNEELLVKAGDRVKMGDPIAKVGASGRSRGMHLHYEVWVNDRSVDPLGFMPPVPGLSDDPDRLVAHTGEP